MNARADVSILLSFSKLAPFWGTY